MDALTDDELVEGAALLAHRAQSLHGAVKNTLLERQGEFIAELEKRFGERIVPRGDGRIGKMLDQCL